MEQARLDHAGRTAISEEDQLRAELYNFLGLLLARAPDETLLTQCATLTGDQSALGQAVTNLAKLGKTMSAPVVESEFNRLFIGLGRGELLPYASYYMTGFLNEKPLALLRRDMSGLALARAENVFEPEDNISSLMEMMGAIISGRFAAPADIATQKAFFGKHIAPWAGYFFADLEGAKNSVFYAAVGRLGKQFMEIEVESFRLS